MKNKYYYIHKTKNVKEKELNKKKEICKEKGFRFAVLEDGDGDIILGLKELIKNHI